MIIVNSDESIIIFSEHFRTINIHSDKKRIMTSSTNSAFRDVCIGVYENEEQCKRAFHMLVNALDGDKEVFRMPKSSDPQLNTVLTSVGGDRKILNKTAGKQK